MAIKKTKSIGRKKGNTQRGLHIPRAVKNPKTGKRTMHPRTKGPHVKPPTAEEIENFEIECKRGLQVWRNPDNGFCVVLWHYTADPAKRDPAFKRDGMKANPTAWSVEMEIDFAAKPGQKVFPEFSWQPAPANVEKYYSLESNVIHPMAVPDWWPALLCTDPGFRHKWATLLVRVDDLGIWHVTHSVVKAGLHYFQAKELITRMLIRRRTIHERQGRFERTRVKRMKVYEHVIDPASKQRRTDSVKTLLELMREKPYPMYCIPVAHRANEYIELEEVRKRLRRRPDGLFGTYFHSNNVATIDSFRTAIYREDGEGLENTEIDPVDAFKYLSTHMVDRAIRPQKSVQDMTWPEQRALMNKRRLDRLSANLVRAQKTSLNELYEGMY